MTNRIIETYATWPEARERMAKLREGGLHAQATDQGEHIALIIDGGKRGRDVAKVLRQLPARGR
jgi:hypothetical protein